MQRSKPIEIMDAGIEGSKKSTIFGGFGVPIRKFSHLHDQLGHLASNRSFKTTIDRRKLVNCEPPRAIPREIAIPEPFLTSKHYA